MKIFYCKFNRRLNGFNWKADRSVMSGIQHTKQGETSTQYIESAHAVHEKRPSNTYHKPVKYTVNTFQWKVKSKIKHSAFCLLYHRGQRRFLTRPFHLPQQPLRRQWRLPQQHLRCRESCRPPKLASYHRAPHRRQLAPVVSASYRR